MPKTTFPTWFPLRSDMMDGEEWAALTVAERALFLTMLRDANQRGGSWYKADMEYAVEVKLSEDKVRRARRKFQALGIVDVIPGFRSRGRAVATTYRAVKWSKPPAKKDKVFFAHMGRYYWDVFLACIRDKTFTHADAVVIASIIYMDALIPGREKRGGVARVAKSELRRLSGVDKIQDSVERLYTGFEFSDGDHLFEYGPGHTHIEIGKIIHLDESANAGWDSKRKENLHNAIASKRQKANVRCPLPKGGASEAQRGIIYILCILFIIVGGMNSALYPGICPT